MTSALYGSIVSRKITEKGREKREAEEKKDALDVRMTESGTSPPAYKELDPGIREICTYWAHGSHVFSNYLDVFRIELTIFSWVIIQDIFLLVATMETLGCFQALAIVNFAPSKIKSIRFWECLGIFGMGTFSKAVDGDCGINKPVTLRMLLNNLFQ